MSNIKSFSCTGLFGVWYYLGYMVVIKLEIPFLNALNRLLNAFPV